jgi:hypothetical protein
MPIPSSFFGQDKSEYSIAPASFPFPKAAAARNKFLSYFNTQASGEQSFESFQFGSKGGQSFSFTGPPNVFVTFTGGLPDFQISDSSIFASLMAASHLQF